MPLGYNGDMKMDYNKLMHNQISGLTHKPSLVLHVCCAPCSSAVIPRLEEHFNITYVYYNPNIYPESEYELRKQQFSKLNVKLAQTEYNHKEFLQAVKGQEQELEGGLRCRTCIAMRMRSAFEYAKKIGAEYATTTLSISPHKDAEFINKTGEELEKEFGVKYLYADFKKENGFLQSTRISQERGIYRQNYCGCEFSINQNLQNKKE